MRAIPKEKILQKMESLNPHWDEKSIDKNTLNLKKRKYFDLFFPLVSNFKVERAVILMGPRRVGKTVLLHQVIQEFINDGISPFDIVYLPLDTTLFYSYTLEDLIEFYKEITNKNSIEKCIIIFDEIQTLSSWDRQLKTLVDEFKNTKFVASGSAAGALRRQSQESGAGRFVDFMLPPLTFYEYLELLELTENLLILDESKTKAKKAKNIKKLNEEFINYLNYGGFPEVVFNEEIRKDPTKFIKESIIDKVIQKDLPSLYGIANVRELDSFFHYLILQTGSEISYQKLSTYCGVSKNTLIKYIEYLEAAFLIKVVKRVDEKGAKMKRRDFLKVYLTNPSMYSAVWGIVSEEDTQTLGHLVETAIFSQWIHEPRWLDKLYYARFKNGEVDMVHIGDDLKITWCLEVKWSDSQINNYKSSLKNIIKFSKNTNLKKAHISTKTIRENIEIDKELTLVFMEASIICFNIGFNLINQKTET